MRIKCADIVLIQQ